MEQPPVAFRAIGNTVGNPPKTTIAKFRDNKGWPVQVSFYRFWFWGFVGVRTLERPPRQSKE